MGSAKTIGKVGVEHTVHSARSCVRSGYVGPGENIGAPRHAN